MIRFHPIKLQLAFLAALSLPLSSFCGVHHHAVRVR